MNISRFSHVACICLVTAGLLPGQSLLAQETRTISYHIGNSRTLDYLATGDGTSFRSALEALAKLAGRGGIPLDTTSTGANR